jgi:3'(2'), 5'-bisphosphate nucleotidase
MIALDLSLLKKIDLIARKAGHVIMAIYEKDFEVSYKSDASPLTQADKGAHETIKKNLLELTPGIPILSEEDIISFEGPNHEGYYWLVDPLDGTREFIKKNGEFTVNIALIHYGVSVLGVVYAPFFDESYFALSVVGAYKRDREGYDILIKTNEHKENETWKILASRSHETSQLDKFLARLGCYELIPLGSSLKMCRLAEGKAHLYLRLGPTSLCDTAASQCIAEEAGGKIVNLEGESLRYDHHDSFLNPSFFVSPYHSVRDISLLIKRTME